MKLMKILFLFLFLFTTVCQAASITPLNAGGDTVINGVRTIFFPIQGAGACAPTVQKLYPESLSAIDSTSNSVGLRFQITPAKTLTAINENNSTINSTDVSIYAEYAGDSNHTAIALLDKGNGYNDAITSKYVHYGTSENATVEFAIAPIAVVGRATPANGYCAFITSLNASYSCKPAIDDSAPTIKLKFGLIKTNKTFSDTTNPDPTEEINIVLQTCPPKTDGTNVNAPALNFRAVPGDKRVKLENSSATPTDSQSSSINAGVRQVVIYYAKNLASLAYSSTTKTAVSGGNSVNYVENLENDQRYCFSLGYVNWAGFVTTGDSWGDSTLPNIQCAIPSQIEGFLNRSSCFIASSVYENEFDPRLESLRQFRDHVLLKTSTGTAFVHWYYSWSPGAAHWVYRHPWVRVLLKPIFAPVVATARVLMWLQSSMDRIFSFLEIPEARAEEVQPYIESLKKKHQLTPAQYPPAPEQAPTQAPAQVQAQEGSTPSAEETQPYLEKVKKKIPAEETKDTTKSSGSALNQETQPYLESLKAGHELKPKKREVVNKSAGFAIVASDHFKVDSDKLTANSFETVYEPQNKYNPSASVFFEYQFFRNRHVGSFGVLGSVGVVANRGKGIFTRNRTESEDVAFRFYAVPLTIGPTYRLVQLRYVVPFIHLGVVAIPMLETRNDKEPDKRAISRGYNLTFGTTLNLDWISRKNTWDQYDFNDVVHTYLLVQWQYLRTISSGVRFNHNGLYAGLMFEF